MPLLLALLFFFNATAATEIYTLSLHDALPIWTMRLTITQQPDYEIYEYACHEGNHSMRNRSEEHTSELQSLAYLVCRLLLEKKKITKMKIDHPDSAATTLCTPNSLPPRPFTPA